MHEICIRVCIFVLCICLDGTFHQYIVYGSSAAERVNCDLECVYSYYVFV